jgi:hypothetical protein
MEEKDMNIKRGLFARGNQLGDSGIRKSNRRVNRLEHLTFYS